MRANKKPQRDCWKRQKTPKKEAANARKVHLAKFENHRRSQLRVDSDDEGFAKRENAEMRESYWESYAEVARLELPVGDHMRA